MYSKFLFSGPRFYFYQRLGRISLKNLHMKISRNWLQQNLCRINALVSITAAMLLLIRISRLSCFQSWANYWLKCNSITNYKLPT